MRPSSSGKQERIRPSSGEAVWTVLLSPLAGAVEACREYREELVVGEQSGRFYHAACHDENARWVWL
jgi:hypothetical protein